MPFILRSDVKNSKKFIGIHNTLMTEIKSEVRCSQKFSNTVVFVRTLLAHMAIIQHNLILYCLILNRKCLNL
jgi:hypothetical protein